MTKKTIDEINFRLYAIAKLQEIMKISDKSENSLISIKIHLYRQEQECTMPYSYVKPIIVMAIANMRDELTELGYEEDENVE